MATGSVEQSAANYITTATYISAVSVPANSQVEKSRNELGYQNIDGYSLLAIVLGNSGTGASKIIPFFSSYDMNYITLHNLSNTAYTVNVQLKCIYIKDF